MLTELLKPLSIYRNSFCFSRRQTERVQSFLAHLHSFPPEMLLHMNPEQCRVVRPVVTLLTLELGLLSVILPLVIHESDFVVETPFTLFALVSLLPDFSSLLDSFLD